MDPTLLMPFLELEDSLSTALFQKNKNNSHKSSKWEIKIKQNTFSFISKDGMSTDPLPPPCFYFQCPKVNVT